MATFAVGIFLRHIFFSRLWILYKLTFAVEGEGATCYIFSMARLVPQPCGQKVSSSENLGALCFGRDGAPGMFGGKQGRWHFAKLLQDWPGCSKWFPFTTVFFSHGSHNKKNQWWMETHRDMGRQSWAILIFVAVFSRQQLQQLWRGGNGGSFFCTAGWQGGSSRVTFTGGYFRPGWPTPSLGQRWVLQSSHEDTWPSLCGSTWPRRAANSSQGSGGKNPRECEVEQGAAHAFVGSHEALRCHWNPRNPKTHRRTALAVCKVRTAANSASPERPSVELAALVQLGQKSPLPWATS